MALTDTIKGFLKRPIAVRRKAEQWPFIAGNYRVLDDTAPVVVVLPNNESLAADLAALSIRSLCMVSPVCRSTSDIEKLIRNVDANLAIHCVVLAGGESSAHPAMEALAAVLGSKLEKSDKAAALEHKVKGKLKTLDLAALQKRVIVENMLGCTDIDKIIARVNKLGSEGIRPNTGFVVQGGASASGVERVIAPKNTAYDVQKDKAGSFTIRTEKKSIIIEHRNLKGELLREIEGTTARGLCITLIRNGWVSRLDHVAYLGRELTLAELALQQGQPYVQSTLSRAERDKDTASPETKKPQ